MTRQDQTFERTPDASDPAVVSKIVREVIRRLRSRYEPSVTGNEAATQCCGDQVVSLESLRTLKPGRVTVSSSAVITPSAREEAAARDIRFVRSEENASDADGFERQLTRRGVMLPQSISVVWADDPAGEVFKQSRSGSRAVMVTHPEDIARFARSFDPQVWVLDRQRFSLASAVHAASMISKLPIGGSR